jgi:hypothetical protein
MLVTTSFSFSLVSIRFLFAPLELKYYKKENIYPLKLKEIAYVSAVPNESSNVDKLQVRIPLLTTDKANTLILRMLQAKYLE